MCRDLICFGVVRFSGMVVEQCHVDVTIRNNRGETALHVACRKGKLDTVRYLVGQCRMNLGLPANNGLTTLHYARYLWLVQFLVEHWDF